MRFEGVLKTNIQINMKRIVEQRALFILYIVTYSRENRNLF